VSLSIFQVYLVTNLVILTLCASVGALVLRANRKRGALIGAVVGMLVGPIVTNLYFFDWSGAPPPEVVAE
jgi:hypothetical protein